MGGESHRQDIHCKKKDREFHVPSRDVTTKLSLGGNNDVITELFLPRGSLVSDILAGDGKLVNLFLRCTLITDIVRGEGREVWFFCSNCSIFCGIEGIFICKHNL
jgi:hypothetical protein